MLFVISGEKVLAYRGQLGVDILDKKYQVFILPAIISFFILWICYPGFMSYDSIKMLEDARSSVKGGIFPAAPVYLLRLFDLTGHGPAFLIQTQNFVLLFSFALILAMLQVRFLTSAIVLLTLLAMPTVIGCMLVLWKDVTMSSLVMLSLAIIFLENRVEKARYAFYFIKWISLLILVIATLLRFNAITGTMVVVIYWLTIFYNPSHFGKKVSIFFLILLGMIFSNKIVNEYSIPNFHKLEPNTIMYGVIANDLIGISGWSRVSLIPIDSIESGISPKVSISEIDKIYSALGSAVMNENNLRFGNLVKIYPEKYQNKDIARAWLAAIFQYPEAYIRYRLDLFSEIIGGKSHATYEPTHFNRIDENPFGMKFENRFITSLTLKYIRYTSQISFGKPWFIFLVSLGALVLITYRRNIDVKAKKMAYFSFLAATFYIIPFLFIPSSGEVRYSFPAIVLYFLPVVVFISSLQQKPSTKG